MTTIALAMVGRMRRCGAIRSATEPTQRVAGHAASATSAATAKRRSPAPAQLIARMRASSAPVRPLSDRSVRCLSASHHSAYPGWTARAFSDQKLLSAMRNSGRQPTHATLKAARMTSIAPTPVASARQLEAFPIHAVRTRGAKPRRTAGKKIAIVQTNRSFVRLISASRLPAMERSERCFVAERSFSISPRRGSRIRFALSGPGWARSVREAGSFMLRARCTSRRLSRRDTSRVRLDQSLRRSPA